MSEGIKVTSLDNVQEIDSDDEFLIVDKSITFGKNASASGRTSIATLDQLKEALIPNQSALIGSRGPKGDIGEKGSLGTMGLQGPTGLKGDTGSKGDVGEKGEIGLPGPVGLPGPAGESITGQKGLKGSDGQKGDRGETGMTGSQGEKGEPGLKGEIGKSVIGPKGTKGLPGPQGISGFRGPVGDVGPKGEQGEKGSFGFPGIEGKEGPKGSKGEKGQIGIQGPTGNTSASISNPPNNNLVASGSVTKKYDVIGSNYGMDSNAKWGIFTINCDASNDSDHSVWVYSSNSWVGGNKVYENKSNMTQNNSTQFLAPVIGGKCYIHNIEESANLWKVYVMGWI